ncbi:hypothetical protein TRV_06234 [Trichophyton verrucosum HKI 0517]|uniref:Uncharacterized protein n=1 Tax=Trichophyton verrucosum (strain HKI 0517) TaxID=663202 RepID=D4DGD1_TRIVH|nr:uncharacterized protein TRV_06234 [Trichophyton verrucosum HKI 0517]EFE39096.1 hypothetical protein TRV_06234 [Trichophyton verrucosum HKI 0517]
MAVAAALTISISSTMVPLALGTAMVIPTATSPSTSSRQDNHKKKNSLPQKKGKKKNPHSRDKAKPAPPFLRFAARKENEEVEAVFMFPHREKVALVSGGQKAWHVLYLNKLARAYSNPKKEKERKSRDDLLVTAFEDSRRFDNLEDNAALLGGNFPPFLFVLHGVGYFDCIDGP